ncbi:metallophosphoesterase [Rhizomonospora bruguierae]|uniref:metallophosphoesterase n=1 Tax=Rhizomonospora bruguierae TaxID=1581705 RepID=UPI001BCC9C8C|nr:metallophosphoesterase [Micromonospora sp. NBRC 107566]
MTDEHEAPELRRPRSLDPMELGFTPRRPVPWLAPFLLLSTGLRTLLAALFGAYLDKRELQNALGAQVHSQPGTGGELWLDYVADLGDGFHSTYSIAYLLAQPSLAVDGRELPRGQVLVMGGDQVYPTASADAYEDRCKGPYAAAFPNPGPEAVAPTLYAVPGNHDWYDGLTAFLRLFVKVRSDNVGAWRIEQSRSYFVVELPQRWWLFAIDEQSGAYLDDPQLIYFQEAAKQLRPGDRVILCSPEPTWVKSATKPQAYDTIDYFVRTIIAPTGARVPLMLSGDLHHYARYTGRHRQLITCGGGGAYLYPTHKLPERITVPPKDAINRKKSPSQAYDLAARYPTAPTSRRLAWGVFARLPFRNPGFATMLGVLHTLLMLAMVGAATRTDEVVRRLFSVPLGIMVLLVMGGAVLFARPPNASAKRHPQHWLLGIGHGLAHLTLGALGAWAWLHLPFVDWPWPLPLVAAAVLYGPVSGLVAAQLTSLYLLVASQFGVNVNELFAGQGIDDYKIFLRLHIAADGALTIYPIAMDRVGRQWQAQPDAPPWVSWLAPKKRLQPYLAEPPITIR